MRQSASCRVFGAAVGVCGCGRAGAQLVRLVCERRCSGGRRPALSHAVRAHALPMRVPEGEVAADGGGSAACMWAATMGHLKASCWTAAWTTAGHSRHSLRPRLTATASAPHVVASRSPVSSLHACASACTLRTRCMRAGARCAEGVRRRCWLSVTQLPAGSVRRRRGDFVGRRSV